MTPSLSPDLNQIAKLLDRPLPQVVVVVGTGVAINATGQPHASWLGLLKHGVRHLAQEQFQPRWGTELEASLDAAFSPFALPSALQHAELIEQAFNTPNEKAFAQWLESAFANFKPLNESKALAPLVALRDLHEAGALLLTTNYDSLLSDITGAPPVTWEEHANFHRVATRQMPGILHIHGHWERPSSIVLGRSSYDRVVADANLQQLFRTLWLHWSWIYVGCGDGLDDPNLGRLLEWSKGWGESGLPDFFLAPDDKAQEIGSRPGKPTNLRPIGYASHDELPVVLRSVVPAARSWPFVRVDDEFSLFHVPGASDPFPTRQEYLDGRVPALAADAELARRLQTHGWACCIDVASVGKTTLALRTAHTHEQREHPVFFLDLKKEIENYADASPVAAVNRLARPGTLLILDNAHYQPELARQLWQQWLAKPSDSRGRLLLVATRIHQRVVATPEQDLTFFERHPTNPAILLQPTPEDLGCLAKHLYYRVGGAKCPPMPEPPAEALAEWHQVYRAALNAFSFAALDSLGDFQNGEWPLPPSRASAWVRKHWLHRLSAPEIDNAVCLAVFGAQELEMLVQDDALPHPGKTERLLELGLVAQAQRGQLKQYRQFELREPGWGRLILAALTPSVDEEQVLFAVASGNLLTAIVLSSRLRRGRDDVRLKRLWDYLASKADGLVKQVWNLPLPYFPELVRLARAGGQPELAARFWETIEADPHAFATRAWSTDLHFVGSFLAVAKQHERDTAPLWALLESQPDKFATSAWAISLDCVGSFLAVAKQHERDTAPLWALLERQPDKFTASVWATSLEKTGSFLAVARQHGRDTAPLWALLERQPDKLAACAWATSLDGVASFLAVAKQHGRKTAPLLALLESQPDKFVASAGSTSLEKTGSFLAVAKQHGRDTAPLWALLERQPDKLAASAWATSLDCVASFLTVARQHGRDTAPVWALLEGQPDKFAASAWAASLDCVASFLAVAKQHGRDTAPLWALLERQPDKFTASAWATSLEATGSFLAVAKQHERDTAPLWALLERQPDKFAASAWAISLDSVASFLAVAKQHGRDTDPLWQILATTPDRLSGKGKAATLEALVGFARYAPASLLEIAVHEIRPGHWSSTPLSKALAGATWLARQCANVKRGDLADDLLTLLLRRANWRDFHSQSGGYGQACWLLANVPGSATELVEPFLREIRTDKWLHIAYTTAGCGHLAAGLRQLALNQSVQQCRQFHHKGLGARLTKELARFEEASATDQSQVMQFLGCAGLSGWAISHRSLGGITLASLSQLPLSILPHRAEAARVADYQMQLWLGLRAFVSVSREKLPLPHETIEETRRLWRANLEETTSTPAAHRVNHSMVAWLETCLRANPPALVPSNEPVWTLAFAR